MKKKIITLVWAHKTLKPEFNSFYVDVYLSTKLHPKGSPVAHINPEKGGKFSVQIRTNVGWKPGDSKTLTLENAKKEVLTMYQEYSNEYQYHVRSLFPSSKIHDIEVKGQESHLNETIS